MPASKSDEASTPLCMQTPPLQTPEQTCPQPPQCCWLTVVSTHIPSQQTSALAQDVGHPPLSLPAQPASTERTSDKHEATMNCLDTMRQLPCPTWGGDDSGTGYTRHGGARTGATPAGELPHPCNSSRVASTSSTWPLTRTFGQTFRTFPSGSMSTVVRMMPIDFFPYRFFSPQAPYFSIVLPSGSL